MPIIVFLFFGFVLPVCCHTVQDHILAAKSQFLPSNPLKRSSPQAFVCLMFNLHPLCVEAAESTHTKFKKAFLGGGGSKIWIEGGKSPN